MRPLQRHMLPVAVIGPGLSFTDMTQVLLKSLII
jgi:hypothetical protein